MEKLFVEKKGNWVLYLSFFILMVVTFGLASLIIYDEFLERTYMTNRRRLIKAIKNGTVKIIQKPTPDPNYFSDIEMFDLIYVNGDVYDLWLWTRNDNVVKAVVSNHIGLFTSCLTARILNKKLVKTIKENING